MRILRRLTLYLAATASLSISLSLAVLWVRSDHVTDELTVPGIFRQMGAAIFGWRIAMLFHANGSNE